MTCPRCGSDNTGHAPLRGKEGYWCNVCGHQWDVFPNLPPLSGVAEPEVRKE